MLYMIVEYITLGYSMSYNQLRNLLGWLRLGWLNIYIYIYIYVYLYTYTHIVCHVVLYCIVVYYIV